MELISRLARAVRQRGLISALSAAFNHGLGRYQSRRTRRWYRKAYASNVAFDQRCRVETCAIVELSTLDVDTDAKSESCRFEPVHEDLFDSALKRVRIDYGSYTFVDLGSGKGKAMLLASHRPFKTIVGVEFSPALCRASESNFSTFVSPAQKSWNFEVICADVADYEPPPEPTVFFLYNPFFGGLMQRVINNIAASLKRFPRDAWIVYCNPDCSAYIDATQLFDLVDSQNRVRVYRVRHSEVMGTKQ